MTGQQGIRAVFPGEPMTDIEVRRLMRELEGQPVSFFFVVMTDGRVGTFPAFQGSRDVPDIPTLLRNLARMLVKS